MSEEAVTRNTGASRATARPGGVSIDRFSVLLVAVAATLWASDAYFRNQLISHLQPTQIVVAEDALITLFLLPVLIRTRRDLRHLGRRGWLAVGMIAVGAQALATILFTASFSYRIFAETFVLQQTQPLIAIGLAWIVLGERRRPWFWPTAAVALVGVYMVVFAYNPLDPISALQRGRVEAGLLALGAAALWAGGTVFGRFALGSISFWSITALRFTLALPVLIVIAIAQFGPTAFTHYRMSDFFPNLLAIALVPGLLALLLYYRALSRTPASLATIAEMSYPVAATLIASAPPPWGFNQPLYPAQALGTALLLGVILVFNWTKEKAPPVINSTALVTEG
ncbi:MAG TPA: DMT family transporter [Candidatus Dormibacteraeota bacterium]|nr:DMT family transporter [Candidatus Dormibacteraeota bacterium]